MDDEEEEEDEEGEEALMEWWSIGLVFNSLRCLLVTRREPISCSRDPGVAVCLLLSKSGNCMGGMGLDKMSAASRWS